MERKARDVHFIVKMQDGTIIQDTKYNSKWTFKQHQAYWHRKAWHEKTSVTVSLFSIHQISDAELNSILWR